jgi:hypothetical protein
MGLLRQVHSNHSLRLYQCYVVRLLTPARVAAERRAKTEAEQVA